MASLATSSAIGLLSGTTALIGADQHTVGSNTNQGAAYVFVGAGGTWSEQAELTSADGASSDFFGTRLSISVPSALVADYEHKVGANAGQGAVYAFVATPVVPVVTSVRPAAGPLTGATTVGVTGTGFVVGDATGQLRGDARHPLVHFRHLLHRHLPGRGRRHRRHNPHDTRRHLGHLGRRPVHLRRRPCAAPSAPGPAGRLPAGVPPAICSALSLATGPVGAAPSSPSAGPASSSARPRSASGPRPCPYAVSALRALRARPPRPCTRPAPWT